MGWGFVWVPTLFRSRQYLRVVRPIFFMQKLLAGHKNNASLLLCSTTMASLIHSTQAMYTAHNKIVVEADGFEEKKGFCGIMFPVRCRDTNVPIKYSDIHTIAVRGQLGPMTVWVSHYAVSII